MIKISFLLDKQFALAGFRVFGRYIVPRALRIGYSAFIGFGIVVYLIGKEIPPFGLCMLLLVPEGVLSIMLLQFLWTLKSDRKIGKTFEWEFDDSRIRGSTDEAKLDVHWNLLHAAYLEKDCVLLFPQSTVFYYFPKQIFSSESEFQVFKDLVGKKMKNVSTVSGRGIRFLLMLALFIGALALKDILRLIGK